MKSVNSCLQEQSLNGFVKPLFSTGIKVTVHLNADLFSDGVNRSISDVCSNVLGHWLGSKRGVSVPVEIIISLLDRN